jgi:hypothetical protein
MPAFVIACITAVAIAAIAAFVLEKFVQESSSATYATSGVRQ